MPKALDPEYVPSSTKTLIDLAGQRFGRWLVVARAASHKGTKWRCRCDCGGEKDVDAPSLRRGLSTSCGCISKTHGDFGKRLYRIWANMLNRCRNVNVPAYKDYGARGVTVCPDWLSYPSFKAWAEANGYEQTLTIERNDVNGNYEPGNCRWMPIAFQAANRRTVRRDSSGRPWCEIAKEHGITARLYNSRLAKGWADERAATTPRQR
jgi:hypothetical protein